MAEAKLITVANAIRYELNAGVAANRFNRNFEPRVLWADREIRLAKENQLRVDIAAIDFVKFLSTRGSWSLLGRFDIGVRKRFAGDELSEGLPADQEIVDLVTLLNDVAGFFMPRQPDQDAIQLSQAPEAAWMTETDDDGRPKTDVVIMWDHLLNMQQFTGYFGLFYEISE